MVTSFALQSDKCNKVELGENMENQISAEIVMALTIWERDDPVFDAKDEHKLGWLKMEVWERVGGIQKIQVPNYITLANHQVAVEILNMKRAMIKMHSKTRIMG